MLGSGAGQATEQEDCGEKHLKHRVVTWSGEGHCERTKHTFPLLMFSGQSKVMIFFFSLRAGMILEFALYRVPISFSFLFYN